MFIDVAVDNTANVDVSHEVAGPAPMESPQRFYVVFHRIPAVRWAVPVAGLFHLLSDMIAILVTYLIRF